jgi:hypothetical protein
MSSQRRRLEGKNYKENTSLKAFEHPSKEQMCGFSPV